MEEDVNSVKKCNHQRSKEKPGIRKFFRNGKEIQCIIYNRNMMNVFLSYFKRFIIVAWRRIKLVNDGNNHSESDNSNIHLYRTYNIFLLTCKDILFY